MTIRYHTRHGIQIPSYICQNDGIRTAQPICQDLAGDIIDAAVSDLILAALTPAAIEVSLALVADALEADWNTALRALAAAREDYRKAAAVATGIDQHQREKIRALATDLPALWNDPATPVSDELTAQAERADQHRRAHVQRAEQAADAARHRYLAVDAANRPLDELKRLPGQRMEPVRHPHPARWPTGQPQDGCNPLGNHDVIPWTASRHALTSSASSARSPARNAARARRDHHERIRRHQIGPRRRHAHQLSRGIEEIHQIRLPRLQQIVQVDSRLHVIRAVRCTSRDRCPGQAQIRRPGAAAPRRLPLHPTVHPLPGDPQHRVDRAAIRPEGPRGCARLGPRTRSTSSTSTRARSGRLGRGPGRVPAAGRRGLPRPGRHRARPGMLPAGPRLRRLAAAR